MGLLQKLLAWLPLNIASLLGIAQGIVKMLKEIITAIVNILFPIIPGDGKFEKTVLKIREWVNKFDDLLQKIKDFFLKATK